MTGRLRSWGSACKRMLRRRDLVGCRERASAEGLETRVLLHEGHDHLAAITVQDLTAVPPPAYEVPYSTDINAMPPAAAGSPRLPDLTPLADAGRGYVYGWEYDVKEIP